jgi:molybdopterin molybdotransferase
VAAIIATGEELVKPGKSLECTQLYDSSAFSIAAQVLRCGGIPHIIGIAKDTRSSIISKIRRGMKADLIVSSGGVSSGDYDLMKGVLAEMGQVLFEQVKMVPGKSVVFALIRKMDQDGQRGTLPFFALPGNPPANMISFEVLVRPAIVKMQGKSNWSSRMIEAVMEDSLDNPMPARRFAWVKVNRRGNGYSAALTRLE